MLVLILNGAAESGKGTVVTYLKELIPEIDIAEYSSIDYVKMVASMQFGWDGKKDAIGRNLLSGIKQLMIAYNDLPMQKIANTITEAIAFELDILVIDVREPEEIKKLVIHCNKHAIDSITCRVLNKKAEKKAEINKLSLSGDRSYKNYQYDYTVFNNGTLEKLKEEVAEVFSRTIHILKGIK